MKFLAIFLFICVLQTNASIYSQNTKLSLDAKNMRIEEVLKLFEKQSDFSFIYRSNLFEKEERIDVNVKDIRIEEFLDIHVIPNGYTYEVINQAVVITKKENNALPVTSETQVEQPGKLILGKVTDAFGEPLPGATVTIKGTTTGVVTNVNGEYEIRAEESDTLMFSFVGFLTEEINVGNQKIISVSLASAVTNLEEVQVVAFGKQKKESVLSSISTVKPGDLKAPSSNITSTLAGKIPGIISYQTSGEPGQDNAQFFVRGVTTFGYKTNPLILIDGFEASSNDLARLEPDNIASFSILKDASATVLYGARGANGIIIVETKSGHVGPAKINVRLDMQVATPTQMPKLINGVDYMKLYNEARITRDPLLGEYYSGQKIQSTIDGKNPMIYPNVDWYDQLFKTSTINKKGNFNISGGGKIATYYVAGTVENETGLLEVDGKNNFNNNIDIKRVQLRNNVIIKITPTTQLDTRLHGRFERYNGPSESATDIFKMVMNSNPVDFPATYEPDEANQFTKHILFGNTFASGSLKRNPYAEMVRGYQDNNSSTFTAMATLSQDLEFVTPGLKLQVKGSVNRWSEYNSRRYYSPFFYDLESYNQITGEYKLLGLNTEGASSYLGNVNPGRDASGHTYFEARINWDREFGKHSIGIMTVGMLEEYLLTGGNSTSIYETLPERNMGNSGRLAYNYDTRYFLEFTYGFNGSEKFAGEKRFGYFPSIAVGWLLSNENFWAGLKDVVNTFKLKASYGMVGNDAIAERVDRFFYLSDIAKGGGSYRWGQTFMNSYSGYHINRYANPDITWEVANKKNLGIEIGLFEDKVTIQGDVFQDIRKQIYLRRENFPATAGLEATMSGNVGVVESWGYEASLDYRHIVNNRLWITGRANITYADNKYVELDEKNYPDEYLKREGYNINQWWGLIAERLFVDEAEIENSPKQDFGEYMAGDIKYTDVNRDGVINDNDRVPMGFPTVPKMQYGFGLSAGYKNFDASFFFQGNAMVSFFIDPGTGDNGIAPFADRRNALSIIADNFWSVTDPDVHAFWPRLSTTPIDNNTRTSTWWLRDGSFIRLKTLELGYNFPKLFNNIGLQNSRIYFSGENLFVLSHFKMWDPEMGNKGLGYPPNKRFNIGLQLSF